MERESDPALVVLFVCRIFFPMITDVGFAEVFKLTCWQIGSHLETINQSANRRWIRNLLILLYWARHYPPIRALGALFGVGKSQTCDILHDMMDYYASLFPLYVNFSRVDVFEDFFLPWCVGIVDGTELVIQSWIPIRYSE